MKEVPQVLTCPHEQCLFLRWLSHGWDLASWFPLPFLGEPHLPGCPCLFVPLFVPPQPQTSLKSVLSPLEASGTDGEGV